jgi:hypothetical protein
MNISQMHERLRTELLRRVQRGSLTVSLLSRQTGFGRSHISNFLHARSQLSIEAVDRILAAQDLVAEDLIHLGANALTANQDTHPAIVPVVSHSTALYEPAIRPGAKQMLLHLPPGALGSLRANPVKSRRRWDRFVAVRIDRHDAEPMHPLLYEDAIAVIDRHYNSLRPHHEPTPNLYAVRENTRLVLRYAEYTSTRLVLRPISINAPVNLIEIDPEASPGEYIAGRVAFIFNKV